MSESCADGNATREALRCACVVGGRAGRTGRAGGCADRSNRMVADSRSKRISNSAEAGLGGDLGPRARFVTYLDEKM